MPKRLPLGQLPKSSILTMCMDEVMYRDFKWACAQQETNISAVLRIYIRKYIEEYKKIKMKKVMKIVLIVCISVFLMNFANAAGLLANTTGISISKNSGEQQNFSIQIINQESYSFFNISVETNNYVKSNLITELSSGQSTYLNFTTISNTDINTVLKIKGFKQASLGAENKTYSVIITPYQSNPCDMIVIKGDTIVFNNTISNQVTMRRSENQEVLAIIDSGHTYSQFFSSPLTLNYYLSISGFNFPQSCHINCLSDTGLVNDPRLDGIFNISIFNSFKPTTIVSNVIVRNYTTDFSQSQEGVMTLTNNGTEIAHNIKLSGEWFDFSANNFDLNPGQSKGLVYTIYPIILSSEDTNKMYNKKIKIEGNFNTIEEPISIFINYASFNSNTSGQDAEYLKNIFCPRFPKSILCDPDPQIIYKYVANASDQSFNISVTAEQYRDQWLFMFGLGDQMTTLTNNQKETNDKYSTRIDSIDATLSSLNSTLEADRNDRNSTTSGVMLFVIFLLIFLCAGSLLGLIFLYRKNRMLTVAGGMNGK